MRNALRWSDLDLEAELGSGQAGTVVRARLRRSIGQLLEGELVAVKRYKPWVLEQPGQMERVFRELETGRRVVHPWLVKTIAVVADDLGRPALIMQYYNGETLQGFLDRHRTQAIPVDVEQLFRILQCLAAALNELHSFGLVHRDVKPANVMLTSAGAVLMDLGVVTSGDLAHGTTTAEFLGTIRYAAPEYLLGDPYDQRADIFSLGTIVFELLMGEQFDAEYQHWARLVAKRQIDYSFSWNADQRRRLTERFGLNVLEFLVAILSLSLVSAKLRHLDLGTLLTAVERRYFQHRFHFDEGKCVLGSPLFLPLGEFGKPNANVTLAQIMQNLRKQLSQKQLLKLLALLKEHYWGPDWIVHDQGAVEFLFQAGVLKRFFIGEFAMAEWHEGVKYAYRCGDLTSNRQR
jgi:serine/threonine protein kinase